VLCNKIRLKAINSLHEETLEELSLLQRSILSTIHHGLQFRSIPLNHPSEPCNLMTMVQLNSDLLFRGIPHHISN
jgi:hypothetical protein